MKNKKLFAILTLVCFMFTLMPVAAFAEGENAVATIGGESYSSLADALTAAADMTGDVTIELTGNVTWETGDGHGSNPMISADSNVGNVTISGNGYTLTATGAGVGSLRAANNSTLIFENLTVVDNSKSYAESSWEFRYLEFSGALEFNKCNFNSGIMLDYNGQAAPVSDAKFVNCEFNSLVDDEYSVWVGAGSATFTNCEFNGTRGLKMHEAYGSDVVAVTVDNCVFDGLTKKPGIAIGTVDKTTVVTIQNSLFRNCQPGDGANDAAAGVPYIYETDTAVNTFAFTLTNNTTDPATGAQIGEITYHSLQAAVDAAKAGDTVTLLADTTIAAPVVVNKAITLNLNGKTINNTKGFWSNPSEGEGNWSLISVQDGGDLTITGEGKLDALKDDVYAIDLRANDAKCTIENGTFVGNMDAVHVYQGQLIVKGGTFDLKQTASEKPYQYLLNCKDAYYKAGTASIIVYGGTFTGFDPSDSASENPNGNFVATGYVATYNADNNVWTVAAKSTGLVAEKDENNTVTIGGTFVTNATDNKGIGSGTEDVVEGSVTNDEVTAVVPATNGTVDVAITESVASSMADKADLVLEATENDTTIATVTLSADALSTVAVAMSEDGAAQTAVVTIAENNNVEVAGVNENVVAAVDVTVTVGGEEVLSKENGVNTSITIAVQTTLDAGSKAYVYYVDGSELKEGKAVTVDEKQVVTFTTSHLSTYAIFDTKVAALESDKVYSSSGGGFSGSYNYAVNAADVEDAAVTFSKNYAVAGDKVTVTVTPDSGKQVDEVIVTDEKGNVITVSKVGDNQYSFTMPAGKVNVSVTTEAIDYDTKVVLQINNKNVVVDNKTIVNDVAPLLLENRTLVPIRVIVEALGGSADWNEATRTVTLTIDGKVLTLVIDEMIPGFGQGATIMDSRTYVPIRYVAEYIGANVEWIAETQQIVILK